MYLRHIYPDPKEFVENEAEQFRFGSCVTAIVNGMTRESAERTKILWKRFSCDASELTLVPGGEPYRMTIGHADCTLKEWDGSSPNYV